MTYRIRSPRQLLPLAAIVSLFALPSLATAQKIVPLDSGKIVPLDSGKIVPLDSGKIVPLTSGRIVPIVSATAPDLVVELIGAGVQPTHTGKYLKIKGGLTVANIGAEAAKNVRVTAYVSDRTPAAGKLTEVLNLHPAPNASTLNIYQYDKVLIPLEYKVPKLFAPLLRGKYLFLVLKANNYFTTAGAPVVFGPLKVP